MFDVATSRSKNHKRGFVILTMLSASIVLGSCQNGQFDQQGMSTAVGGVAGALSGGLLGKALGGGSATILSAVGGAAAGAWIGNRIGQYLDERDREELSRSTQVSAVTGTPQTWRNPDTGATVATKVTSTRTARETVAVPVLKGRIEQVPPLDLIGAPYRAKRSANVRGGPGADYVVSQSLAAGQTVDVIGKVQDSNWYMVGEGGAGSGFVATSLLEAVPPGTQSPAEAAPAPSADVETVQVATERKCRTIEQTVTTPEGPKSEKVTACQGPNGWEVI